MSLLVISLLVTLSIIYKQMKKLRTAKQSIQQQFNEISEVNGKLQETNEIKDQYIFQSLYGKSDYLDKVENLLKKQDRKLKARQFNDLQITHKEFDIKSERENMFSSFDQTFLKLFPNFLTEYNKFFRPDDQVILDEAGNLPPELCIFALIRLGVTENEQIEHVTYPCINIVGGGANAAYLNELTAKATGKTVYAGPTEATAIGNIMAQMIAAGELQDLAEARKCVFRSFEIKEEKGC